MGCCTMTVRLKDREVVHVETKEVLCYDSKLRSRLLLELRRLKKEISNYLKHYSPGEIADKIGVRDFLTKFLEPTPNELEEKT